MNKRTFQLLLSILGLTSCSILYGYEAACTYDSLQRSVRVEYGEPSTYLPCEVIYRKNEQSQDKALWKATNDLSYCTDKAQEFVKELTKMGWKCDQTKPALEANINITTD